MKILITGASGFVGQALWQHAVDAGHEVLATGRRVLKRTDYLAHDLAHPIQHSFRPDLIFHIAARSSPWGRRREFVRDNVTSTQNVLDFARRSGLPHVVHLSTAAVLYDHGHQPLMSETTRPPKKPINLYAETKLVAESLVRAYPGPWTILRPRAVFGPGDTVVFPRILRAAQTGRLPWIDADRPVFADLIYIETLTDYLLRAARQRITGLYHLSNAEPVELRAFLTTLFERLAIPPPRKHWPAARAMRVARMLEISHRLLPFLGEPPLTRFGVSVLATTKTIDAARMLRDLGPPSVPVAEGVERFIAWQLRQSLASREN